MHVSLIVFSLYHWMHVHCVVCMVAHNMSQSVIMLCCCHVSIFFTEWNRGGENNMQAPPPACCCPVHCAKEVNLAETEDTCTYLFIKARGEKQRDQKKARSTFLAWVVCYRRRLIYSFLHEQWLYEVCVMSSCLWINCVCVFRKKCTVFFQDQVDYIWNSSTCLFTLIFM